MIEPNIGPTLGLKDMHPMQVKTVFDFIELAIELATFTDDVTEVRRIESAADELIKMLGGKGIKIIIEDDDDTDPNQS